MATTSPRTQAGWRRQLPWLLLLVLVAGIGNLAPAWGQFTGEDEVMQLQATSRLLGHLAHPLDPRSWGRALYQLSVVNHPPLRFFLSLPGVWLMPHQELGVRLGAWLVSFLMIWQMALLGRDLGGWRLGWLCGLLLAASGVMQWTSMAFAWSVIVTALSWSARRLLDGPPDLDTPRGRRTAHGISGALFLAFLTNTGCVVLLGSWWLALAWAHRRRPRRLAWSLFPWVALLGVYYLWFLALFPWLAHHFYGDRYPLGQLAQNLIRSRASHPNLDSLRENLQGLNAYVLPFASWALVALGLGRLARRHWAVLALVAPYLLAWSFYLAGNSQQYFLLAAVVTLPFGLAWLADALPPRRLTALGLVLAGSCLAWNLVLFQVPYRPLAYPQWLLDHTWSLAQRKHNLVEPYARAAADLAALLPAGTGYASQVDGAFADFYASDRGPGETDSRLRLALGAEAPVAGPGAPCWRPAAPLGPSVAVLISRGEPCPDLYRRRVGYPGTRLSLYLLSGAAASPGLAMAGPDVISLPR